MGMGRPRRIGLRHCDARDGWERGSTRGQMQKLSRGSFMMMLHELEHIRLVQTRPRLIFGLLARRLSQCAKAERFLLTT
jgi:hypothetical protein